MDKIRVINARNLPPRVPIAGGLVLWLSLDHIGASGTVRGIAWTLFALYALLCVGSFFVAKSVNIRQLLEAADTES